MLGIEAETVKLQLQLPRGHIIVKTIQMDYVDVPVTT